MLLKDKSSNHMVEIANLINLIDVNCDEVVGRYQEGEEAQDPEAYTNLIWSFFQGKRYPAAGQTHIIVMTRLPDNHTNVCTGLIVVGLQQSHCRWKIGYDSFFWQSAQIP